MKRLRLYVDERGRLAINHPGFSWLAAISLPVWALQTAAVCVGAGRVCLVRRGQPSGSAPPGWPLHSPASSSPSARPARPRPTRPPCRLAPRKPSGAAPEQHSWPGACSPCSRPLACSGRRIAPAGGCSSAPRWRSSHSVRRSPTCQPPDREGRFSAACLRGRPALVREATSTRADSPGSLRTWGPTRCSNACSPWLAEAVISAARDRARPSSLRPSGCAHRKRTKLIRPMDASAPPCRCFSLTTRNRPSRAIAFNSRATLS
jgi:hypothetical protein